MKTIEKNVEMIDPAPPSQMPKSIRVRQYDLDGNYVATYDSMNEAAKAIKVRGPGVWDCIHGKALTCGGFQWKKVME